MTIPGPPKTHRLWGGAIAEGCGYLTADARRKPGGLSERGAGPGDCFQGKQVNAVNWPEGGVSEGQKFAAKPMQSETDSSDYFSMLDQFFLFAYSPVYEP